MFVLFDLLRYVHHDFYGAISNIELESSSESERNREMIGTRDHRLS